MDPSMKNWILSLLYLNCTIKNRVFRFRLIKREVVNTLVKKSKVNLKHSIVYIVIYSLDGRLVSILYVGSECGQYDI